MNINFYSGALLQELQKYNDAIIMYDRAIQINPNSPEVYDDRGDNLIILLRKCIRITT